MSVIHFTQSGDLFGIHCPNCSAWVGNFEIEEITAMSSAQVKPLCFDCDKDGVDVPPKHLLGGEDFYLVGIGSMAFLAEWLHDDIWYEVGKLLFKPITWAAYYAFRTGDIRIVQDRSLSSSTYQHKIAGSLEVENA